jgi:hypothetical protein
MLLFPNNMMHMLIWPSLFYSYDGYTPVAKLLGIL